MLAAGDREVDLTRYGIFATVVVPEGLSFASGSDGEAHTTGSGPPFVRITRERLRYSEFKARYGGPNGPPALDELGADGEFVLGWPPWTYRVVDHGRISCMSLQADAICQSIRPRRVGEILRLTGDPTPTLEKTGERWTLGGLLRLELDGLDVPGAKVRLNGVELKRSKREPAGFEVALPEPSPGMELRLAWEANKARGEAVLRCPKEFSIKAPYSASRVQWTRPLGAEKVSLLVSSYDPREKVALPGGNLSWSDGDGEGDTSVGLWWFKPPYVATVTAFGPTPKTGVARLSCALVRRATP